MGVVTDGVVVLTSSPALPVSTLAVVLSPIVCVFNRDWLLIVASSTDVFTNMVTLSIEDTVCKAPSDTIVTSPTVVRTLNCVGA